MRIAKVSAIGPNASWAGWPIDVRLRDRKNVFRHRVGAFQRTRLQSDCGEGTLKLLHTACSDWFRAIDQRSNGGEIILCAATWAGATRDKLKSKVGQPGQRALMFADEPQHSFRVHHPAKRRLHYERYVVCHGEHEAGDHAHVVVERKPAINPVRCAVNLQRQRKMFKLTQHSAVEQRHALLQPGGARGMLDECHAIALIG